jgi:hypothetical protein
MNNLNLIVSNVVSVVLIFLYLPKEESESRADMRTQNDLIESSELSAFLLSLGLYSYINFCCFFIRYY